MYSFLLPIVAAFMTIFHPWKAIGLENIPEGGYLLCGNHTSLGDPIYVACAMRHKRQIHVMAKEEIMHWPIIGFVLKKAGIIGVKRGKADISSLKESMRVLRNDEPLLLFPEGTRVKDGQTGEARSGAAMLATKTGVPVVPVYISPEKKVFKKTTVKFGNPYIPEFEGRKASPEDYHRIANDLMERIHQLGADE